MYGGRGVPLCRFYIFFNDSDHLEQFGGVVSFVAKLIILTEGV